MLHVLLIFHQPRQHILGSVFLHADLAWQGKWTRYLCFLCGSHSSCVSPHPVMFMKNKTLTLMILDCFNMEGVNIFTFSLTERRSADGWEGERAWRREPWEIDSLVTGSGRNKDGRGVTSLKRSVRATIEALIQSEGGGGWEAIQIIQS